MKRWPFSVEEGEEAEEVLFVPLNQRVSQSLQLCLYFSPQLLLLVRTFLWIDQYKLVRVTDMTDMAKVGRITMAEKQWHVTHTMKESALFPLVCPLGSVAGGITRSMNL